MKRYDGRFNELKVSEIACRCGCGFDAIPDELAEMFMVARRGIGLPLRVNSGCRCESHNRRVGGALNSAHITGQALDITLWNFSGDRAADTFNFVRLGFWLGRAGFRNLGINCRGAEVRSWFYHVDIDHSRRSDLEFSY